jgi:hypothetical protein
VCVQGEDEDEDDDEDEDVGAFLLPQGVDSLDPEVLSTLPPCKYGWGIHAVFLLSSKLGKKFCRCDPHPVV